MEIRSSAFGAGGAIPAKYTCDGDGVSPPLSWSQVPEGTQSLALIVDDPDAPAKVWVHWVMYEIPAETHDLPEALPDRPTLEFGARQGKNDFNELGYGGACPPSGTHRYQFKLYALDTHLDLPPGATKQQVLQALEGHVLAQAQLEGKYRR